VTAGSFDLIHDLSEIVARWSLHRRELFQAFEPFQPELLANRQHIPIVNISSRGSGERAANAKSSLHIETSRLLERVALDIVD
jgi:hypothetical protein